MTASVELPDSSLSTPDPQFEQGPRRSEGGGARASPERPHRGRGGALSHGPGCRPGRRRHQLQPGRDRISPRPVRRRRPSLRSGSWRESESRPVLVELHRGPDAVRRDRSPPGSCWKWRSSGGCKARWSTSDRRTQGGQPRANGGRTTPATQRFPTHPSSTSSSRPRSRPCRGCRRPRPKRSRAPSAPPAARSQPVAHAYITRAESPRQPRSRVRSRSVSRPIGMSWRAYGLAMHRLGRMAEAINPLFRALELLPGDHECRRILADALRDQGRHAESETQCLANREGNALHAEAHRLLGMALQSQMRLDEAEASCRRAV